MSTACASSMQQRLASFSTDATGAAARLPSAWSALTQPPAAGRSRLAALGDLSVEHARGAAASALHLPLALLYAALALLQLLLALHVVLFALGARLATRVPAAVRETVAEWRPSLRTVSRGVLGLLPEAAASTLAGVAQRIGLHVDPTLPTAIGAAHAPDTPSSTPHATPTRPAPASRLPAAAEDLESPAPTRDAEADAAQAPGSASLSLYAST
jgi:hypothetical protein